MIAVDKWHLVALAHTMVTEVRQRVAREQLGRRGAPLTGVGERRMLPAKKRTEKKRCARERGARCACLRGLVSATSNGLTDSSFPPPGYSRRRQRVPNASDTRTRNATVPTGQMVSRQRNVRVWLDAPPAVWSL